MLIPMTQRHSGLFTFHCDESLACFLLHQTKEFRNSKIIRSRDPKIIDNGDIVVDVGSIYNPSKYRFDHHQREFNETMNDGLCMFEKKLGFDKCGGIFISGQWSAFIPVKDYSKVYEWTVQNRGDLDALFHPNSGFELYDHSIWASWAGKPWPLNLEFFDEWEKVTASKEAYCNEWGCTKTVDMH